MTKSTGARARQHRLENLLWADVMLRRVNMHLLESIAWARHGSWDIELRGLQAARSYVRTAYLDVIAEQKALRQSGAECGRLHVAYAHEDYRGAACYPEARR
jgi:hypothetical protein